MQATGASHPGPRPRRREGGKTTTTVTTLLAHDCYEERLATWTVVFPNGGFPNVHAEWLTAL